MWKTVVICLTMPICRDSYFVIKINNLYSIVTLKTKYLEFIPILFFPARRTIISDFLLQLK